MKSAQNKTIVTAKEKHISPDEWNSLVSHPMQSWEWGEIKKSVGNKIVRFLVIDNDKPVRAFLITLHKLAGKYLLAYCPRSKWINSNYARIITSELYAHGAVLLKLEPDILLQEAGIYKIPLALGKWKDKDIVYKISNSSVFAQHTFYIDTTLSDDELMARMKPKTRYNIRLAQRKGVYIKETTNTSGGFDVFFSLYEQTIKRQQYLGHGREYHKKVWNVLKRANMARIYTAIYKGKPLASYMIVYFKNRAYYVYGGSSSAHREVMASNLLMWKAVQYSRSRGAIVFDMWGALPKNYNKKDSWAGFHRFKEGYGGMHRTYVPSVDIVLREGGYRLFSGLWHIRTPMLRLIRRVIK